MILACPVFISCQWDCINIITKVVTLLGIFLGEVGIYLFYTLKPLEDERQNKVYTIVYFGIHVVLAAILMYVYVRQGFTHNNF